MTLGDGNKEQEMMAPPPYGSPSYPVAYQVPQVQVFPQVYVNIESESPNANYMDRADKLDEGVTMKQTAKSSCPMCCCQKNFEWTAHKYVASLDDAESIPDKLYILEDSPMCARWFSYCAPGSRKTSYNVYAGGKPPRDADGNATIPQTELIWRHRKAQTNGVNVFIGYDREGRPIRIPQCCCLPYLETVDVRAGEKVIGRSEVVCCYDCDNCSCCVPKFMVKNASGELVYYVKPATCCCGCCVLCTAGGKGGRCLAVPFIIRDPKTKEPMPGMSTQTEHAEITNLWAGLKKECCMKDNYAINFPVGATYEMKATLMGTSILVDMTTSEHE